MVTLEQVEKLREYANISYDEAKTALENADGDILQALIELEQQGKVKAPEGGQYHTDHRRGKGVFGAVWRTMEEMNRLGLFFGVSITVTKGNLDSVTDDVFISSLQEIGCRLIFFVEYVPVDGNTKSALEETERNLLAKRQRELKVDFPGTLFLCFPGDEKALGGCLAAGRGFFHINAFGDAEPCPFSPYSDTGLKTGSLQEALASALFQQIRESGLEAQEHAGGCALFSRKAEVAALLQNGKGL